MKLHELASRLGLTVLPTTWVERWDAFERTGAPRSLSTLMNAQIVDALAGPLRTPAPVRDALTTHLRIFRDHPPLTPLFEFCHHLLYHQGEHAGVGDWPIFKEKDVPAGNMFYAYLFLAGRDHTLGQHRRLGIPVKVTDDTLRDIFVWMEDYRGRRGEWGLDMPGWVANYVLKNKLFQIGRLQYVFNVFKIGFRGYRHRASGRVVVLAREGRRFRADGQFEGTNQRLDPDGPWTSTLEVDGREIRGHVVHPDGYVLREPRTLPTDEWGQVFDEGSPALSVHIPAGAPLSPDECRDSLREAMVFFPRHFPDRPFDVVWCHSWLMDGQLKAYLPPTSNVLQFQNEFYLLPYPNTSGWQTLERTFGSATVDLGRVEAKTSLQRAVLQHIRGGGAWRCAAGVIFPGDDVAGRQRSADWLGTLGRP